MKDSRSDSDSRSWFQSLNCDARYGAALAAVVCLILALNVTGEAGRALLGYQREALRHLQWWRLLTAHLVHLGWLHALLNCGGLILLWVLFARELSPRRWLAVVSISALVIDLGLWLREPDVEWYLGASGVLHGIWAAGACAAYRRGDSAGAMLMVLLVVKLVYEQHAGASVFEPALPMVPAAHLLGALGGCLAAVAPTAKSL
jgi:rhomboid family GlyGly-CTERM serine protease